MTRPALVHPVDRTHRGVGADHCSRADRSAATASGSRPAPPQTGEHRPTAGPALRPPASRGALGSPEKGRFVAQFRRNSAGTVAANDNASARPAYTPPSNGSTRVSTAPPESRFHEGTHRHVGVEPGGGTGVLHGHAQQVRAPRT